jgi:hypothetical protein
MGRTKKTATPEPTPVIKKTAKKPTRSEPKSLYKRYLDRISKSINVPPLHHDAVEIVDNIIVDTIDRLAAQYRMLVGTNKKFTTRSANLGFLAFVNQLGAPKDLRDAAIKRATDALVALEK